MAFQLHTPYSHSANSGALNITTHTNRFKTCRLGLKNKYIRCVYLVKTPAARPMVVSLALSNTSSSVSKDNTDMTGPNISSFTQDISSVQFPIGGGGGVTETERE